MYRPSSVMICGTPGSGIFTFGGSSAGAAAATGDGAQARTPTQSQAGQESTLHRNLLMSGGDGSASDRWPGKIQPRAVSG